MKLNSDQKKFLDYYNFLPRTSRKIPSRESLKIQDIPELLGNITILKIVSKFEAEITLNGSLSEELLNTSLTGVNIYDLLEEREKILNSYLLTQVMDQPCAGSSTMIGTITGSHVTATHNLSVPFLALDGESISILVYQQFNTVHADRYANINKSLDAIHISHIEDIHTYDIGYGIPEDDGTIAKYNASLAV
jgi:hypothetical protein